MLRVYWLLLVVTLASCYQYGQAQDENFAITPGNVIAKLGRPARLDCQLRNRDNNAILRWLHETQMVGIDSPSCNCQILSNFSLLINEVSQKSRGNYTCYVSDNNSILVRGSLTIAENPVISSSNSELTRDQNQSFRLNISVTGVPQPAVFWLKDGANFTSESTGVTATDSGLIVKNAQYKSAGRYDVRATNCADTDAKTYNIFIRFLPIVTLTRIPDSDEVAVGAAVTVTCSAIGYPESSIQWEQHTSNEIIRLSASTPMTDTSNHFRVITKSMITFNSTDVNGASSFCCKATNAIGPAVECLNFTEHGAPPTPSGFGTIERTPSSITVQWNPSSLDGVTYKLQYRISGSQSWTMMKNDLQNVTQYTLNDLRPDTSYDVRIISQRDGITSLPTKIITRTRISVPGDIMSFNVDSKSMPGTFILTWQAPRSSIVDFYIVYVRGQNKDYNDTVNATETSYHATGLSENVEYMFAVQAVNDGGKGNMTNFRGGIFCLKIPTIIPQKALFGTTINISWQFSDSVDYSSRRVMLTVAEMSGVIFTSKPMKASNRHLCISNLRPNTRYEIKVIAILGCDNISSTVDILTQSPTLNDNFSSSQNCIVFNSTVAENSITEESNSSLEAWVIALIVIIPLVGVAVMLSIGIYCACKKRSSSSKGVDAPAITNTSSQAPLSHHTRNHSTSSYTGSFTSGATTPIRSPASYHSRSTAYRYNGRIEEHPSAIPVGGQQY